MTFSIDRIFFFLNVKLPEEIERDHSVYVYYNRQQHDCEHQLLSVVSYGLQNGPQGFYTNSDIQKMSGEEEVVEISQNGKHEVVQ